MQQPGERHFRKRLAAPPGDVVQVADLLQARVRQNVRVQEPAIVRDPAVGGNAVEIPVRQQSLRERREGDQPFAEAVGRLLQPVALHRAVEDVVAVLVDDERHMHLGEDGARLFERRAVVVRQSHVQRLAAVHRGRQRAHGLLQRRGRIHAVVVEDVDVVEAEAFQALVERGEQVFAAAEVAVWPLPHLVAGFGADDELVAVVAEVFAQQTATVLFRGSRFRPVVVGEVEMRDAVVERGEHDTTHGVVWRGVAEIMPESQRDGRQLESAVARMVVGHGVVAFRRRRVYGGWFEQDSSLSCSPDGVTAR